MTNEEIYRIAMKQSAEDVNCRPEDFLKEENVIAVSTQNPRARKYLELPFECNLVSYGNNIVASVDRKYEKIVREYIEKYPVEHCFETPNLHVLDSAFSKYGMKVCFMAEYFLPDLHMLKPLSCEYEMRLLGSGEFHDLYSEQWSNALCEKRKELNILGVGAYYGDRLIGLAGCSADCDDMWQIGVDVLPEYRKQGVAAALTSRLALKCLERGKVPFYCCAWSNIASARNAIRSGFRPAWVEMTVKPADFVDNLNGLCG